MNHLLRKEANRILIEMLEKCTPGQQGKFQKMYSHKNPNLSIKEMVEQMDDEKISWAITQCENTIELNRKNGNNS